MFTNYILVRFVLLYNGCHINKMFPTYNLHNAVNQATDRYFSNYLQNTAYK